MLPCDRAITATTDAVAIELEGFANYLTSICGLAPATRDQRVQAVGAFLVHTFGTQPPILSQISVAQMDAFFAEQSVRLRPASLRGVCNSLRSYFRYRALLGDSTAGLAAALPRISDWRRSTLPKALSDSELDAFLNAFDRADPVGQRDYAIARCLLDLGAVTK